MTKQWRQRACEYREFARIAEQTGFVCDFSEAAAEELFQFETFGIGCPRADNGFAIGKSYLNVQIEMWQEDLSYSFPLVAIDEIPIQYRKRLQFPVWMQG